MKKRTVAVLTAVGVSCVLAACSGSGSSEKQTTAAPQAQSGALVESEAAAEDGAWKPEKAITIIVPYEAGGNSDIPTRVFAKYMAQYADVDISITNITGAGGRTGAKEAMNADPDGYTYLLQSSGFAMQSALGIADFTYQDFEPVGYFLDSSMALVVSKSSPYETLDDFIAKAKENPGIIKMGTVTGTLPLFGALYLEKANEISLNKVDLGSGAKAPELLSNRIDAYIDGFGGVKQYIDSGDFRCLAVFGNNEITGYEDIPTLDKLGYTDFDYLKQNFGLWAPKGTDTAAVKYVNGLIEKAAADPACQEELGALCYKPMYTTVEEYTDIMETIYNDFAEAAKAVVQ